MKKQELQMISDCDGLPLSVMIFEPETEEGSVKGVVQISHGMAEHKERYYPFMEFLAENGYASVINDHRGHGKSVREKEDKGYFYDDTAEYVVADLHQITAAIRKMFPQKPLCLFGHSMGSLIVRKYIKKYDFEIEKLVVCGSPSKNPMVGAALLIVGVQKVFKGERHRSRLIQKLAFGSYNKNIKNPVSSTAWLSANEDNVKAYDKDEDCGYIFTLNGFKNLFTLLKEVYKPGGWVMKNKDLPIFFVAGEDDPVTVSPKEWQASMSFLRNLGYNNVSGKMYTGLRHEILNEKQARTVYEDILTFIENGN